MVDDGRSRDDGLEALYRDQAPRMVRLAFLLTGGGGAAEELVHDAFLQVQRHWDHIEHPAAYLRTAVVHAAASHRRRRTLELVKGIERRTEAIDPPPPPDDDLRRAIVELPARQRAAVVLRYYEDLPDAEIAALLDCGIPAVKSLLHRALQELREVVER